MATRPQKSIKKLLQLKAEQFCSNTALHGYKFIVLPKRTLLERVIWGLICLASLITALTLLCIAWFNFQENPTVLVTDSTRYPIWNYVFPAITVCNYNIISKRRALELAKNLTVKNGRTPEEIVWDLRLLLQLVNSDDPNIKAENYTRVYNLLKDNTLSVDAALKAMTATCSDTLIRCKWKGESKRCETMFEPIRTSEGFCCSFNYFALKNHTFGGILANKAPKRPRRVSACGQLTALEFLADNDPNDYFGTHIPSFGIRVFIHNPYVFPDWSVQNILIETNVLGFIAVSPTLTYSTGNIKQMPIETRQCLFPNERTLLHFELYNFHNCMVECRMNLTIKLCGCVTYYNIHNTKDSQKICTTRDVPCLAKNEPLLTSSVPGFDFATIDKHHEYGLEKGFCDCLPDCEMTDYQSEYSTGDLNIDYLSKESVIFTGPGNIRNQSLVKVYFNDLVATRNRRDVIFTWHTLLAYYGGILGLFTGFSFVSGMEIIYFFVIRLLADVSKDKKIVRNPKKITVHNSDVNIQPTTYEHLDPRRLAFPNNRGIRNRSIHSYLE